jgi:DNA polymerase-3 subunit gamma/tau
MLGSIDRNHVVRMIDALSRGDGAGMLAEVQEFDRDAPDYDRALIEVAAFLQRVAIAQTVPDAAPDDEDFDTREMTRLAKAIAAQDVQLYYQIALGGRRDLSMAPEPRLGFEMTLLRMLAFRPDVGETGGEVQGRTTPASSAPAKPRIAPVPSTSGAPVAAPTVDSTNWSAILDAAHLSGMVRQFALNCVPASFDGVALNLQLDAATTDRRTRQIEEKLAQGLSKYFGRDIRLNFEAQSAGLVTPASQRSQEEQDRLTQAVAAFEQDPAVRGLRERFGAETDLLSVKP